MKKREKILSSGFLAMGEKHVERLLVRDSKATQTRGGQDKRESVPSSDHFKLQLSSVVNWNCTCLIDEFNVGTKVGLGWMTYYMEWRCLFYSFVTSVSLPSLCLPRTK